MPSSSILGAAIGLAFIFFLVALLCSAIVEWWANLAKKRAKYLLRGFRDLLDTPTDSATRPRGIRDGLRDLRSDRSGETEAYRDALASGTNVRPTVTEQRRADPTAHSLSDVTSWTTEVLGHPLVRPFKQSRAADGPTRNPSYLPSRTFAAALIDILVPDGNGTTTVTQIRDQLRDLPEDVPLKRTLLGLLGTAENDLTRFTSAVEQWYDDAMDRISGSYKRWAKRWIIAIGLVIAVALQVDSIQVGTSLYTAAPLRDAVTAAATNGTLCPQGQDLTTTRACVTTELKELHNIDGLPVGWGSDRLPDNESITGWLLKGLGWALTALAASFGAPFWFQALSKLGSLRNTGTPPARSQSSPIS